MQIKVYVDRLAMSRAAARHASRTLREAIAARGSGANGRGHWRSQFDFLEALTATPGIDWTCIEMFHLDEYVGLSIDHPASFRRYLQERLISKTGITRFHFLDGEHDPQRVANEVGHQLSSAPIDIAFVGIGENGHLRLQRSARPTSPQSSLPDCDA